MPDQPSEIATASGGTVDPGFVELGFAKSGAVGATAHASNTDDDGAAPTRRSRSSEHGERRRPRRTDWRLGGQTVLRWREGLIAWACFSLGVGVLGGFAAVQFAPPQIAPLLSSALLWLGMLVPIIIAFSRSRPIGLLRFRPLDLLWGVGLGLALRLFQGFAAEAAGGGATFPSFTTLDGQLPPLWWVMDGIAPVVVAPVIEEFFFRAVILVSLYTVLRRAFGKLTAALAAWLVTTALFVIVHTIAGSFDDATAVSLSMVGAVCGALVILTGRIWGAVLTHIVFNATAVALAVVGTLWG